MSDQPNTHLTAAVAVKYIGKREPYIDRLYGTGLAFTTGQVRMLPFNVAPSFLQHTDLFEKVKHKEKDADKATKDEAAKDDREKDDTQEVLEQQKKLKDKELEKENIKQSLRDQINTMEKDAVVSFVKQHYNQDLSKNLSLANARKKAISLIDEFGA